MHVCKIWDNDLTWYQVWYKLTKLYKDFSYIFSPQIGRKRSEEYLVINLAVEKNFERFSCLELIFENSKHREGGLKHKFIKL